MPETPIDKIHEHPAKRPAPEASSLDPSVSSSLPAYAELQVASNFSFLRGASHPDELAIQAAAMGCRAVAITDINTLAGVVRAHVAAKEAGIRFVVGCRIEFHDSAAPSFLLFPTCRASYGRLCRLLTRGKRRAPKGECHLTLEDIIELNEGLLAVVLPPDGLESDAPTQDMAVQSHSHATPFIELLRNLKRTFDNNRLSLATSCLYGPDDEDRLEQLAAISREAGVPLVATNDVHYHVPQRRALQDVLTCIRHITTIDKAGTLLFPHGERYIKGPAEMARLFARYPQALARTMEIASRAAAFSLDQLRYEYPHEVCPPGKTPMAHLRDLTWRGAMERYAKPPDQRGMIEPGGAWLESPERKLGSNSSPPDSLPPDSSPRRGARLLPGTGAAPVPGEDSKDLSRSVGADGESPCAPTERDSSSPINQGRTVRHRSSLATAAGPSGANGQTTPAPNHAPSLPSLRSGLPQISYLPNDVILRLEHEFQIIEELGYAKYFLTVYDIVKFARSQGILCQGRGAAANSAVCYCLGVTSVDPARIDLLFERFVSKERNEPPDIDIDFEHERREEVIQYIYGKYGRDRAALTCEVISYRGRSAVRDVGKAMGLSLDCVDRLAKQIDWWQKGPPQEKQIRDQGLDPSDPTIRRVAELTQELLGFPRHLSQHVGGFVITQGLLEETVPIENAAMPDRTVIEWDKDDIDAMGMLKVDCLGLGMLTAIRKAFHLIEGRIPAPSAPLREIESEEVSRRGAEGAGRTSRLSLASLPPEDPDVYKMIQHADTVGVFQIESRAQMSMLPRLKPENFYDLVIEVAIVRPGPIQGNMVHPYLRRRMKLEQESYPNEAVEAVLKKTLGVPLFQEQAMRLAIVAAGFTPGEADQLRRAIAAWKRRPGLLETFGDRLVNGMLKNGYTREFADRCYEQIQGFSGYGFPESHAASFALLVYSSAWIKRRHPAAFCAGLLNSQPMGFYAPAQLVRDAKEHGVEVRPIDVNLSMWDCTLERKEEGKERRNQAGPDSTHTSSVPSSSLPSSWGLRGPAIRLGLRLVSGLREDHADMISHAVARHGPFKKIRDLWLASNVPVACLKRLASADAFNSMGLPRRQALWEVRNLRDEKLPLFDDLNEQKGALSASSGRIPEASDPPAPAEQYSSADLAHEDEGHPSRVCARGSLGHDDPPPSQVPLPTLPPDRAVLQDYATIGLSLKAHPISFLRPALAQAKIIQNAWLKDPAKTPHGRRVAAAGIVLVRQRPGTASGIVFMTIEDETGVANLVIRPQIFEKYRKAARHSVCVAAWGRVERVGEVVHVLITRIEELSRVIKQTTDLSPMSRDFH